MNKTVIRNFIITGVLFLLFVIFTVAVLTIDVRAIGPNNSSVGLATINDFIFKALGINSVLFAITDWLGMGLVAICVACGFAVFGIVQLIKRKSIAKVDLNILLLGAFYLLLIASFIFFEFVVINFRPIILDGKLAPSFPSTTTLVVIGILGTAILQFNQYLKNNKKALITVNVIAGALIVFTVIGRLLSGAHWFTDIIGGVLLSGFLIMLYYTLLNLFENLIAKKKAALA